MQTNIQKQKTGHWLPGDEQENVGKGYKKAQRSFWG